MYQVIVQKLTLEHVYKHWYFRDLGRARLFAANAKCTIGRACAANLKKGLATFVWATTTATSICLYCYSQSMYLKQHVGKQATNIYTIISR